MRGRPRFKMRQDHKGSLKNWSDSGGQCYISTDVCAHYQQMMYLADMYCWLLIRNIYFLNLFIYIFNIYVKDT